MTTFKTKQQMRPFLKSSKKTCAFKSMFDFVKNPVLTEKTSITLQKSTPLTSLRDVTEGAGPRKYIFDVDKCLTKTEIKKLFENLYNVNVIKINTHVLPNKKKYILYKRVLLTFGSSIDIYDKLSNKTAN